MGHGMGVQVCASASSVSWTALFSPPAPVVRWLAGWLAGGHHLQRGVVLPQLLTLLLRPQHLRTHAMIELKCRRC
eukprot:COSAG01_NODE_4504_length_4970_cov_4.822008_7_plen_75_part_00